MPRLASTVVLVRENRQTGINSLETLLLLRNTKLSFEGGAWVFPGGKVDQCDYPPAQSTLPEAHLEYRAAINAAVRETREESGLVIAPQDLIHIAHWTTPTGLPRRYATWFFLCPVRSDEPIKVDDEEILDYQWLQPEQALKQHEQGIIRLPMPTCHTLESIAPFRNLEVLCDSMTRADIHVFPENSDHYRPIEGLVRVT
ncbi:NUDIX hydrolase [Pseudohongiella spirulinae]|uniref:NUDIX domain protein n=1 Tax=Pseudohongiella spirulinae TaxID=1249552 RepID=A0A0S2KBK7_9GAMM|nr:NUDIX hydrolase [Pseudohongiella spirulinae]ALO45696.1 NUDIX domain protein [Pseudohongiella spirulinae]